MAAADSRWRPEMTALNTAYMHLLLGSWSVLDDIWKLNLPLLFQPSPPAEDHGYCSILGCSAFLCNMEDVVSRKRPK